MPKDFHQFTLTHATPGDAAWQPELERIDATLRAQFGLAPEQTAAGVLDLRTPRLALVRPDRQFYGASVPKIGILLGYFHTYPAAATDLATETRQELGAMIKRSSNEIAAKYSQALGLPQIRAALAAYQLYDADRGGGLWVGKHYGVDGERHGDPVDDHSHAATVRQVLRFYLLLEQGRLVSPAAARTMREIFATPELPHREDKFVRGLAGRAVQVLRKAGWWEDWQHDSAIVTGPGRHYLSVALTHHPRGEEYLVAFARAVDDWVGGRETNA